MGAGGSIGRVHLLLPDHRAAGARRPGADGQPGLQLPGGGRADLVHERPGVLDRGRLGLPAGLHRAGLPVLRAEPGAASDQTGDLCWSSQRHDDAVARAGRTPRWCDDPTSGWHAEADNGEQDPYQTGTGATAPTTATTGWSPTPDGTSYYFGLNQLPGYASGDATTNSAWTVPVYADGVGPAVLQRRRSPVALRAGVAVEPGLRHRPARRRDGLLLQHRDQLLRRRQRRPPATASYTQGGALDQDRVRAAGRQRCTGDPGRREVNFTTATDRTDVPTGSSRPDLRLRRHLRRDLADVLAKYQLTTIATQRPGGLRAGRGGLLGAGADYPSTGDDTSPAPLWLESITRTGEDGTARHRCRR